MTFPMTISTKPRGLNESEIILKYSMTFQAPAERAIHGSDRNIRTCRRYSRATDRPDRVCER